MLMYHSNQFNLAFYIQYEINQEYDTQINDALCFQS